MLSGNVHLLHNAKPASIGRIQQRQSHRRKVVVCFQADGSNRNGDGNTVRVALKIPYRVSFGQNLGVVGSGDALGNWEPTKCVKMIWTEGDFWTTEIAVDPRSTGQIEYKYVVLNPDGRVCHWKPGSNYNISFKDLGPGAKMLVQETWDEGSRKVAVEAPTKAPEAAEEPPAANNGHVNGSANGQMPSSNGHNGSANGRNGSTSDSTNGHNGSTNGHAGPVAVAPPPPPVTALSTQDIIQQQTDQALSELRDALSRHEYIMNQMQDPVALEVIMADRLLAAANNKAVTLNNALKAAEAFPHLPTSKRE